MEVTYCCSSRFLSSHGLSRNSPATVTRSWNDEYDNAFLHGFYLSFDARRRNALLGTLLTYGSCTAVFCDEENQRRIENKAGTFIRTNRLRTKTNKYEDDDDDDDDDEGKK